MNAPIYEQYGSAPRVSKYDVVLTGAGISGLPPSSVPSGDELMRNTWARLLRDLSEEQRAAFAAVSDSINHADPVPIWLEPLAEIVDSFVQNREILVSTYVDVSTQQPNSYHQLLADLDTTHVTLNMDTLLEAAGADAWHVHGRWDEPSTIVTTVRQYSDGLSSEHRDRLVSLINGASVLIIGYSGRDTDVMPVLASTRPRTLHWMHYGDRPVEATVQRLASRLGAAMTIFSGDAREFLPSLGGHHPTSPSSVSSEGVPADRYGMISPSRRLLTAAGVAFDLGHFEVALDVLSKRNFDGADEIIRRKLIGEDEITRRKIIARAQARLGEPRAALRILRRPPRTLATLRAWPRVLNEVASLLPRAGSHRAGAALNRFLTRIPRARDSALLRIASARQSAGDLYGALRILRGVSGAPGLHRRIGITGVVDALTLHADTLKLSGDIVEAQRVASRAVQQVPYANSSQKLFALRRRAELAHIAGDAEIRMEDDERVLVSRFIGQDEATPITPLALLKAVYSEATVVRDGDVMFWSAAVIADVHAAASETESQTWAELARSAPSRRGPFADGYLLLVDAERARKWASAEEAIELASRAILLLRSYRLPRLAGELSLIHSRAALSTTDALRSRAASLERQADRIGAATFSARALILRTTLEGLSASELAAQFRARGWVREAEAALLSPSAVWRTAWPVIF